jgi:asparagine synthase (glutamine-hydrolysing)
MPGNSMTVKNAGVTFNGYFKPILEPDTAMTETGAIEQLKYLLNESIKDYLPKNGRIGTYLSGNMDTSAIAVIAAKKSDTQLHTFVSRYENSFQNDEQNFLSITAAETYTYPYIVDITPTDLQNSITDIVKHLDHPVSGPAAFARYMIAQKACSKLKILINALGGNELFLGDSRYIRNLIECSLIHGQKESVIRDYSFLTLMKYYWQNFGVEGAAGFIFKRGMANFSRRCIKSAAKLYGFDICTDGELATAFKHLAPLDEAAVEFENIETSSLMNRVSWFDATNRLSSLLHIEDRMNSAWSLESRSPLLDNRLIEFAYKIPSHLKIKYLQPQYIFSHAANDIPTQPIGRHAENRSYSIPTPIWFHDQLAGFIKQFVTPEALAKRGIFNPKLATFFKSDREYFTPTVSRFDLIWALMNVELWFQLYVDDCSQEQLMLEPVYKYFGQNVK